LHYENFEFIILIVITLLIYNFYQLLFRLLFLFIGNVIVNDSDWYSSITWLLS